MHAPRSLLTPEALFSQCWRLKTKQGIGEEERGESNRKEGVREIKREFA